MNEPTDNTVCYCGHYAEAHEYYDCEGYGDTYPCMDCNCEDYVEKKVGVPAPAPRPEMEPEEEPDIDW